MEFILFHFELKCYEVSTTPRLTNEGRNMYSGYPLMFIASNWKYFLGDNQTWDSLQIIPRRFTSFVGPFG